MFETLRQIWHSKSLRNKIGFTVFAVLVFRFAAHIPVPGANIENVTRALERNQLLGIFSVLTGGGLEQFSIVLMGISPYITASIIVQLLTVVIPKLEAMSKEGEQGRTTLNRYTRFLTVPLAFLQSYGMIKLIEQGSAAGITIISDQSWTNLLFIMLVITTGTLFLMWLGEIITEKGIGNGISVLIFAGIISSIPTLLGPSLSLAQEDQSYLFPLIVVGLFTLLLTVIVIIIAEGQRQIPITYAGQRLRSDVSSHLPIRVNQAGMIPIIFAVSLISFPSLIASFFQNARTEWLRNASNFVIQQFGQTSIYYMIAYFLLVFGFTFFYVNLTFKPVDVADNVQKRGGFIPGIRPGRQTAEYLQFVSNRITLLGAVFLSLVAVLPIVVQQFATQFQSTVPLLISGAGLIIVVGVVLELVRQVNAQLAMQDYERFY